MRKNGSVVWECQCDCGNIHYVAAKELTRGSIHSCGCLQESIGSLKIKTILNNNNINYITEATFTTCKFPDTKAFARFDFCIPQTKTLIEYDGPQHFQELDTHFFRDNLKKRQQHDKFKNQWCIDNNYQLYRIPYYSINSINTLEDILNDKFLIN